MSGAKEGISLAADVRPREVWAWAMYDFANSGYTTVVITAIFNAYFVVVVAGNKPWATLAWTLTLAVSYLLIMVTAPIIGAYADARAAKKKLLIITTAGCVLFTAALAYVGEGGLVLAIALVILTNFFFGTGENLVAAFLPELAQGKAIGRISGYGWSLGYIGGLVSLGCSLAYVTWAQAHGYTAAHYVPVTMVITAVIFALASLPTFLVLRERAVPQRHVPGMSALGETFTRLAQTIHHARRYGDLWHFLVCLVFYQAGIQTVIALAAIYAQQVMSFGTRDTLLLIMVVNITAAAGAFLFGQVQDRLGHITTIALTLIGWISTVLVAWSATGVGMFWVAANLAGLSLGSSQSAGRALVGYLSPPSRHAEFFGLWGLAVKLSSILGPVTYGMVSWISHGDHRLSMLITGVFFIIGLLILFTVDVGRGRRAVMGGEQI